MSDTEQGSTPVGSARPGLLQLVRDNFSVFSLAALVVGIGMAVTFLASYLLRFDWRLLWFVQYTDVLTFGLIALGVIAGSLSLLVNAVNIASTWNTVSARSRRIFIIIACGIAAVGLIFEFWSSARRGEGIYHDVFGAIVVLVGIAITVYLVRAIGFINSGVNSVTLRGQLLTILIYLFLGAAGLGTYLGYLVLETPDTVDIKTKDGTMTGMKVIIVMSRHTVFLKDKDIFIVPTSDITEFHGIVPPYVW